MGSFILFGSAIGFGIALAVLFLVFLLSDIYENGYAATSSVIAFLIINYFWGNFAWVSIFTWYNVGIYLLIGFIFSLVRTYFKGKEFKIVSKPLFDGDTEHMVNEDGERKESFELKEHVFRWWFLFPFAAINWVFGRLLIDAWDFIYRKTSKIYESIFNA